MSQPAFPFEKVGIARIRIRRAARGTAVLGSFVAADKLLKAWAAAHGDDGEADCEFEIRYLDGACLSGRLPMWRGGAGRHSLGAHVRRALVDGHAATLCVDTPGGAARFLERYEVEDFAAP